MSSEKNLILAVETAIGGGSLSIRDQSLGIEVGSLLGEAEVSKAEDVLENIEKLLKNNNTDKKQLGAVALTTGAGSATGLKIGAATAKGLAKSLNCEYLEISLWDVFAKLASDNEGRGRDALSKFYLPAGKERVGRLILQNGRYIGEIEMIALEQLRAEAKGFADTRIYIYETLAEKFLAEKFDDNLNFELLKRNLAGYISKFASDNEQDIHTGTYS